MAVMREELHKAGIQLEEEDDEEDDDAEQSEQAKMKQTMQVGCLWVSEWGKRDTRLRRSVVTRCQLCPLPPHQWHCVPAQSKTRLASVCDGSSRWPATVATG
jgi:hypothetical protein